MRGTQCIGPEGFTLSEIDRHIDLLDGPLMTKVFGADNAPICHAVEVVRAQGSIALGDIGCGTGNTLSSWRTRVAEQAPCDPANITGIGITLFDYSPWRDETAQAAWTLPGLRYMVGDITKGVAEVADNTFDTVLSYASAFYWRNPETAFDEARRMTKPGGRLLFNTFPVELHARRSMNARMERIIATMNRWRSEGVAICQKPRMLHMNGEFSRQYFYKVDFPK